MYIYISCLVKEVVWYPMFRSIDIDNKVIDKYLKKRKYIFYLP